MSYGRSKDGAVLDTTYSEEHTLSERYKALEGFSGKKYKKSQEFVSSDKESDTTSQPLTAEDVIRSAENQPKFTYNAIASDLLVFSAAVVCIIFAGGLVISAAIAPIKASFEQLSRELPVYPNSYDR